MWEFSLYGRALCSNQLNGYIFIERLLTITISLQRNFLKHNTMSVKEDIPSYEEVECTQRFTLFNNER